MQFRFTIGALFLATATIAVLAGLVRVGGFSLALVVSLAFGGLCVLIRSDWATTVEDRVFLILFGLGLLAAAAFLFLLWPAIH
jgi:hypothetical protein